MHQQPRNQPPRQSPAPSPQLNLARTNTNRDGAEATRPRAGSGTFVGRAAMSSPTTEIPPSMPPPPESIKKLEQIVQNFFIKTSTLILESRMKVHYSVNTSGARKTNKWFQLDTDEIDDFRDDLAPWKTWSSSDAKPAPLIIETYLDTSKLGKGQALVILDEENKSRDVMEQINAFASSSEDSQTATGMRHNEVILERWRLDLSAATSLPLDDFGPILPTVYKRAIIFFRSLFLAVRLLPSWKFARHGSGRDSHPALIPQCRIRKSEARPSTPDLLRTPIDGRLEPVSEYMFGDIDVPIGRLGVAVTYRTDCSFRVEDSEALLSDQFMGNDESMFQPSLPHRAARSRDILPEGFSQRDHRRRQSVTDVQQTYGSLSTFHGDGPLGTSPLSALKAVKQPGSNTSSPPSSLPSHGGFDPPNSLPIQSRNMPIRPGTRPGDSTGRRPSISFQAFKAGSLSGSPVPRQGEGESPASPQSLTRPPSLLQPRNRTSLTAGMPATLRGGPSAQQPSDPTGTSSPRPGSTSRYSSSFTHRRGRLSFGGASKTADDEQGSSGRQSLSSSVAQPGSGFLAEPSAASSGSLGADEDNISEFLKALDSKKTLKSFDMVKRGDSATNKTVAQLSKFHQMRDSNNALTESMTSSMQLNRSSGASSRQIGTASGVAASSTMSISSSPGKPLSPHTPHVPANPSRLSENSVISYDDSAQGGGATRRPTRPAHSVIQEASRENTLTQEGVSAIDIPLSPRVEPYQRRSSSVAQRSRALADEEEAELAAFAQRSLSLGADDRDDRNPPTRSILLGQESQVVGRSSPRQLEACGLQPAADIQAGDESPNLRQGSSGATNPLEGFMSVAAQSTSPFGRRRYIGMASSSRQTPPQSSRGSFTGSTGRFVRGDDESLSEEPLVFDLSEMDAQGRRSLEESRGPGSGTGPDRPGFYETRGTTKRGW